MVAIAVFLCILLILMLQSYYTDSDTIKSNKIDGNYLEQQSVKKVDINIDKKKQSKLQMEVIKVSVNKPKISNLDQKIINNIDSLEEQKIDDIDSEYIDIEDSYAEPKPYNQEIDSIELVEVVNFTSDYEKDVLKQLMEYEGPKQ